MPRIHEKPNTPYEEMTLEQIQEFLLKLKKVIYSKSNGRDVLLDRIKDLLPDLKEVWGEDIPPSVYTYCVRQGIWSKNDIPTCKNEGCDKPVTLRINSNKGLSKTCGSYDCHNQNKYAVQKKTNMERYGVECLTSREDVRRKRSETLKNRTQEELDTSNEKRRNTIKNIYGVDSASTLSVPSVREKAAKTNMVRYGVENVMMSPVFAEKSVRIRKERGRNLDSPDIKKKWEDTQKERLGMLASQTEESRKTQSKRTLLFFSSLSTEEKEELNIKRILGWGDRLNLTDLYWKARKDEEIAKELYESYGAAESAIMCGVTASTFYEILASHDIEKTNDNRKSWQEIALCRELESHGLLVDSNNRRIFDGLEIDIFLPEYDIGIEYNGLRWHSTEFVDDPNKHVYKQDLAEEKDIRLIQVFEDEWTYYREQTINRILNEVALSTLNDDTPFTVSMVPDNEADQFFSNHITEEYTQSCGIYYGAYIDGELVSSVGFSGDKEWPYGNITHMIISNNTHFDAIVSAFCFDFDVSLVECWVDRRWVDVSLLANSGFLLTETSSPTMFYVKGQRRFLEYPGGDRYKIYDAGHRKYTLNLLD